MTTAAMSDSSGEGAPGESGPPARQRILVVEDQDDVRRMLATALQIDGYEVSEASSAAEGLSCLRQARYNLVLSDYAMPGGTGTWMLQEAARQGLLEDTPALIVTAHRGVGAPTGVEVVSKPLDLDAFLAQVRRILMTPSGPERDTRGGGPKRGRASTHKVELVLYVSSASATAAIARRNLARILNSFDTTQVKSTVCDLMADPMGGEEDRIAFTPTLVKRYPEPRMWVIGNLKEPEVVVELLKACGVDSTE